MLCPNSEQPTLLSSYRLACVRGELRRGSQRQPIPNNRGRRPMQRYKISLSYDGSGYCGWQIQPNGITVQERLEAAIGKMTGTRARVHGSGRTDQGVHARCQVAHCDLPVDMEPRALVNGLNGILPLDIRIISVSRASDSFHARRSARGKEYRYFI